MQVFHRHLSFVSDLDQALESLIKLIVRHTNKHTKWFQCFGHYVHFFQKCSSSKDEQGHLHVLQTTITSHVS
jgi:hypothetical protein